MTTAANASPLTTCENPVSSGDIARDIARPSSKEILATTARYQGSSTWISIRQVLNTFVPFFGIATLMYFAYEVSPWITLLLAVPAALFIVRMFIIQHDCGHGSFFNSRTANNLVGMVCSLFTFIPYYYWRRQHAIHHATNGLLEQRGQGDVDVLTVKEYLALPTWQRFKYRAIRNPYVFMIIGPIFFLLVSNRFAFDKKKTTSRERANVHITNVLLALMLISLGMAMGFEQMAITVFPTLWLAAAMGIWLFYVQHQFEQTYWEHTKEWDYVDAALKGSSFLKLPRWLSWFTGDIGLHHIHHLSPLIPNYKLEESYNDNKVLQEVTTLSFWDAAKTLNLCAWDEDQHRLISFRELRAAAKRAKNTASA
jgi:omega-6 fatty acid desaturase (delta-12 desaturase)